MDEESFDAAACRGRFVDLRDHPLQRDHWWGSPQFEAAFGPLHINDILARICADFGIAADVYGAHWSVSGADVPDEDTPDSAVYLPGRNLLLLAKASVWCALHDVDSIALGTLKGNPFADCGPTFSGLFEQLVREGMDHSLSVLRPFVGCTKVEVVQRGRDLALQHTFSCIDPVGDLHCGRCNKCAERRRGFAESGVSDRTVYADQ